MTLQVTGPLAERGDDPLGDWCPMDRALQAVGNRTALLLVREAFYGTTRFDQLWRRVGVGEAAAAQRLRDLVATGVLEKRSYQEPGQRRRQEYVLTPAGHDLMPVIIGLLNWGAQHVPSSGAVSLTHDGCAADVHAVVRCAAGHDVDEAAVLVGSQSNSASTRTRS